MVDSFCNASVQPSLLRSNVALSHPFALQDFEIRLLEAVIHLCYLVLNVNAVVVPIYWDSSASAAAAMCRPKSQSWSLPCVISCGFLPCKATGRLQTVSAPRLFPEMQSW